MTEKHFILATAGHVDHGKSALVKALTGTDPDRLPEEKVRGITIDLGFAHLELSSPSTFNVQPSTFSVGLIDVPGHEDFVRNMIAGVGSVDLALLVVAANEGWMPQTEEHLQIVSYLGVKRLVVALTKIDLADPINAANVVREKLRETEFANAQLVATSIRTGAGLDDLKSALAQEVAKLPAPRDISKPRLFIDRTFTLRGIGTIVTGTLIDGGFRAGQTIFVQPRNNSARIRSLQSHGSDAEVVHPGTRVAMNLADLQIGTDVERGDVITAQQFEPASTLDVQLTRSPRSQRALAIKSGSSAYVHHGTKRVLAKITFRATEALRAGESAHALLKLQSPLPVFVGDHLILRDASERQTIAGAVVLNLDQLQSDQERALIASRAVAPDDVALAVWTEIARGNILVPSAVLQRSRFIATEIAKALQGLAQHGEIFLNNNVAAKMVVWRELRQRAADFIDAFHKKHPERRGLELTELRSELNAISPDVFDELVADLCQSGFARTGSAISRGAHRAVLPPQLQSAAEKVRSALMEKPFDPAGRKDLTKDREQQQALKFLIQQGEIVEISEELVLIRDVFDQMRTIVASLLSTKGPATASQLREELGTSRRVIIPFLEYLDKTGVTQRAGDLRKLREPKSSVIARS